MSDTEEEQRTISYRGMSSSLRS